MERLIDLVKYNRVDVSKLVTHVFKGFEYMEEALLLMKAKSKALVKPVVMMEE